MGGSLGESTNEILVPIAPQGLWRWKANFGVWDNSFYPLWIHVFHRLFLVLCEVIRGSRCCFESHILLSTQLWLYSLTPQCSHFPIPVLQATHHDVLAPANEPMPAWLLCIMLADMHLLRVPHQSLTESVSTTYVDRRVDSDWLSVS